MPNLNRAFLIGNCTRDPELRYTPQGTAVVEIGLAVNRVWKDEAGNKQEEVTYVDITLWGRTAEVAGQYLKKGSPCMIEGRLQLDTWDDKQTGQKRSKLRVIGERLQLLGSVNAPSDTASSGPPRASGPVRPGPATPAKAQLAEPDDIPY
jgi:single-strand DNA-binding protein